MESAFVGKKIIIFKSLRSTNDYCKELLNIQKVPEGIVINASWQSGGRGHGNNSWESAAEQNLTFSIILHPRFLEVSGQFFISMITSLGITDFLKELTSNVFIKWPNDIYIEKNKIAGILTENSVMENRIMDSIVGIGININQTSFDRNIPNPVSLVNIVPAPPPLENCLKNLCNHIDHWYSKLKQGNRTEIQNRYTEQLFRLNEQRLYRDGNKIFRGYIRGVDKFGRLALETETGATRYFGLKEVEFL